MKKNILFLIIICCFIVVTGCTNSGEETKKIGDIEEQKEEQIDYESKEEILGDPPIINFEPKNSIYINYLTEKEKVVYDDIKTALLNYEKEILLSQKISEGELDKIMNIILMNTPELFHIQEKYSYEKDSNSIVFKIYPSYGLSKEDFLKYKTDINRISNELISGTKGLNEYDAAFKIFNQLQNFTSFTKYESNLFVGTSDSSIFSPLIEGNADDLALSKLYTYLLRLCGINSEIIIGKLKEQFPTNNFGYETKAIFENVSTDLIVKKDNKERIDVFYDFSKIHAWNLLRIKNQWYHADLVFSKLIKNNTNITEILKNSYFCLNDNLISNSHFLYINEFYFPISPQSNNVEFLYSVKNNFYIKEFKNNKMEEIFRSVIDEMLKQKRSSLVYVFESQKNYNDFLNGFNDFYEKFNKDNQYIFNSYKMNHDNNLNLISIENVSKK